MIQTNKLLKKKLDKLTKRYPILVGLLRRLTMIKIKTIENRIPNVTRLIATTILNTKVTRIENKI